MISNASVKRKEAAEFGYFMPAEWGPQEAVWLSWPVGNPQHWSGGKQERIEQSFAAFAAAISEFETVRINVNPGETSHVRNLCLRARAVPGRIEIFEHPHDDVWCRDHGPIFLRHRETGEIALSDWEFNAWGEKFSPWDKDNQIPSRIANSLNVKRFAGGMVLEGGAIEVNGAGALLTTEAVLLNPNRNPELSREQIEEKLRKTLGVERILWLKKGIVGDDTDGHIDDLARFCSEDLIVAAVEKEKNSPNYPILAENLEILRSFSKANGRSYDLVEMPMPEACEIPGWRLPVLPASYVNFLIVNEGVLVPSFQQPRNDDRAQGILRELFPDRKVVAVDALDFVEEGGSLHCLSQQQPAPGISL